MAIETANRVAGDLLPAGLLDARTREALLANPMPGMLIAAEGGHVLWSSHVVARRLGMIDGAELIRAGLPVLAAGTQRLAVLARGLVAEAPKRLERLRFNIGFRSLVLTALCEPLARVDGTQALLVCLIEARPIRTPDDMVPTPASAGGAAEAGTETPPQKIHTPETPQPEDTLPEAVLAEAPRVAPAWLDAPVPDRMPLRFLFTLDAAGVVERVTPPLAAAVGAAHADIVGHALASVVETFDPDAAEVLHAAITGGETWNNIVVRWPVAGSELAVPIHLSALPRISPEAGFTGFSGFGRCHPAQAAPVAITGPDAGGPSPGAPDPEPALPEPALSEPALPEPSEAPVTMLETGDTLPESAEDAPRQEERAEVPQEPQEAQEVPSPVIAAVDAAMPPAENRNVVPLRAGQPAPGMTGRNGLSTAERHAFREIARALGAKFDPDAAEPSTTVEENTEARLPEPVISGPVPSMLPVAPQGTPAQQATPAQGMPAQGLAAIPPELLDRLPIGMLVLREDTPLFANRTLLDLTGYPDFDAFVAGDGPRAIFRKGTLPRDRQSGFDTVVLAAEDGEMIPVDAHLQIIDWQGEKATLISMRRAAELEQGKALRSVALDLKRVRAEAQELRAVLDTATDGVITLDEKGRILSLNGAAEALFGLSQNEVAGESFTTLLLNESHADALDYFEGLQANGVRSVLNDGRDVDGREKKGGRIPLFMTLGRISDDEPRRYCAVLRDLTAWKRAEAELTDARRAAELASAKKSDFLAKISHEIRTPMNAIIGFAEVMMEERLGPVGSAKYKEYLGDIRTSGKHVVSLVNDLLDLAKIEAGRMEMNFAATDLNALVSSSVGIIQPQANANRVLVRTQLAQKLPAVVADERSIRQIILNMLANATRFTESGGQVIVATALLESGEAVIRIRDTGVGMSATEIDQALEPFRQVGTRRDHGGTGLGLPLTKALVEANRASFAIRSTPGEGTMVEITFPSTRVLAE
jgi:PAS domain S-box-containing protein